MLNQESPVSNHLHLAHQQCGLFARETNPCWNKQLRRTQNPDRIFETHWTVCRNEGHVGSHAISYCLHQRVYSMRFTTASPDFKPVKIHAGPPPTVFCGSCLCDHGVVGMAISHQDLRLRRLAMAQATSFKMQCPHKMQCLMGCTEEKVRSA